MEKGARTAEKLDISNVAVSDGEVKRIFIGGVGPGVTSADMVKTFSPLGRVHAVEFVRNNGRNFAYMDFEPSSVKSMANLFSTYNGCTWKGGKLKLEMAKEHYLARLKREWAEDAKLASAPASAEENLNFDRSHLENLQIRIFFPKLGKVKVLPLKGTGKRKCSFQQTEVPPFPIHFCSCEEHLKALETTSQNDLSPLSIVVHEKERNIINKVLNKLIDGDTDKSTSGGKDQNTISPSNQLQVDKSTSGQNTISPSNEGIPCEEGEVSDTDDDNLVMNFGARAEDDIFILSKSTVTPLTGQESRFGNPEKVQDKADSGKRKKSDSTNPSSNKPNKRARFVSANGLPEHQPAPAITPDATSFLSATETASSNPFTSSEGPAHTPNLLAEPQENPNPGTAQPAGSHSWVQKSSWKNLIEGEGSSSFSISTLLSGLAATSPTKASAKPTASDADAIPAAKPEPFGEKSKQLPCNAQIAPVLNPKAPPSKGKTVECKTSDVREKRKERVEPSFGGACPFMRCAESEQQWAKAKAALTGFIKKKSNEERVSKFARGTARGKR